MTRKQTILLWGAFQVFVSQLSLGGLWAQGTATAGSHYCLYVTNFDPAAAGAMGDITFETLRRKLIEMCGFEAALYQSRQLATARGIELTFQTVLNDEMRRSHPSHLLLILEGLEADSIGFFPPIGGGLQPFSFSRLGQMARSLPIASVTYLLNLVSAGNAVPAPAQVRDSLILVQTQVAQNAMIWFSPAGGTDVPQRSPVVSFLEGIDGGADANMDSILEVGEIFRYVEMVMHVPAEGNIFPHVTEIAASGEPKWSLSFPLCSAFALPRIQGGSLYQFDPEGMEGPCVLLFGAKWCAPCSVEKLHLQNLLAQLPGFQVIYVSRDAPGEMAQAIAETGALPFVCLHEDPLEGEVFARFALNESIPLTVLVSRNGEIRYRKHGYDPSNDLPIIQYYLQGLVNQ